MFKRRFSTINKRYKERYSEEVQGTSINPQSSTVDQCDVTGTRVFEVLQVPKRTQSAAIGPTTHTHLSRARTNRGVSSCSGVSWQLVDRWRGCRVRLPTGGSCFIQWPAGCGLVHTPKSAKIARAMVLKAAYGYSGSFNKPSPGRIMILASTPCKIVEIVRALGPT
jgi:hypothetical protein